MKKTSIIGLLLTIAVKVSFGLYLPEGEFDKRTKLFPKYNIRIDLRKPLDYTGIPKDEKWFPMGSYEFCAIQGGVTAEITLPNGSFILEEFAIVYIDRDLDGIFRIRADSSGWLDEENALKRLQWQLEWIERQDLKVKNEKESKAHIENWIQNYTYQMNTYESLQIREEGHDILFSFFNIGGFRYCYQYNRHRDRNKVLDISVYPKQYNLNQNQSQ